MSPECVLSSCPKSCQMVRTLWHHHDITTTSSGHPATLRTCRWVKWPTALILHIKLSVKNMKKKKRDRKEKRTSLWRLFSVIGQTGPAEGKRWWEEIGGHMLTFSIHNTSSQHQYKEGSMDGWMDGWGGEKLFSHRPHELIKLKKRPIRFQNRPGCDWWLMTCCWCWFLEVATVCLPYC